LSTKLTSYLPVELKNIGNVYTRLPADISDARGAEKKCDSKKLTAASLGNCIISKKTLAAELLARQLTATKENRAMGLYYMSVIADNNGQHFKSLWFIEKALALEPEISMFNYQKGKIVYTYDGIDAALPSFEKSIDLKRSSKEISLISGIKSFSDKDFITASDELKKMNTEDQDKYNVAALLVESTAQKGNSAEAIKLGETFLSSYPKNVDMYLQLGRVYEEFPENAETSKKLALEIYQKALGKSENNEQKNWLKRKISFLSEAK
jgi:tetratricopeptide (TPR) repeat protein